MMCEVLIDQRLNPRKIDVTELTLGAFDGGGVLAAGENGETQ